MRVPERLLGIRDFPYVHPGVRDFKAKWGRDSRVKPARYARCHRDYWIEQNFGRDDKVDKGKRRSGFFRRLRQIRSMSIRHRHCFVFVAIETD